MPQKPDQPPDRASKRVCLGTIAAPHGVKGLVKILPFGENPALIEELGPCFTSEHGDETVSVTLKNPMGKYILASIEGCDSREKAEERSRCSLFVSREILPQIEDEDTFYYEDLKGLQCVNGAGEALGAVTNVHNFGAGDLLEIRPKSGGETFLLPFTNENILDVGDVIMLSDITKQYIET